MSYGSKVLEQKFRGATINHGLKKCVLTLLISTCGEGSWLLTSSTSPTATQVDRERELASNLAPAQEKSHSAERSQESERVREARGGAGSRDTMSPQLKLRCKPSTWWRGSGDAAWED